MISESSPNRRDCSSSATGGGGVRAVRVQQLVSEHYQVLYRYAYRLTGSHCDAEDLTQQTFLTAQTKFYQLREASAARGWLFQILRRLFLKACRQRKPQTAVDSDFELEELAVEQENHREFDIEQLQQRLNELPENYRLSLLMFYFEGKSCEEIATEMDVALGTVMSRLARAKAHLRVRLRSLEVMK